MWFTRHVLLHLVPRVRMCGAVTPLTIRVHHWYFVRHRDNTSTYTTLLLRAVYCSLNDRLFLFPCFCFVSGPHNLRTRPVPSVLQYEGRELLCLLVSISVLRVLQRSSLSTQLLRYSPLPPTLKHNLQAVQSVQWLGYGLDDHGTIPGIGQS
jgi:hypothetical protein